MPNVSASSLRLLACMLFLQSCIIPSGQKWATDGDDGPSPVQPVHYVFGFPGTGDTVEAGTRAVVAWTEVGHFSGEVVLSLWRDSDLIADNLGVSRSDSGSMPWDVPWDLDAGPYRLRIARSGYPKANAFSEPFPVKPHGPDAFEPDDIADSARPIGTDGLPQARNLAPRDTDWIRFSAETGRRYLIEWETGISLAFGLADSAGRELRMESYGGGRTGFTADYAGRYYLRAYPRTDSPGSRGPYRMSILAYEPKGAPYSVSFSAPAADTLWSTAPTHAVRWYPETSDYGPSVTLSLYSDTVFVCRLDKSISNTGSAYVTVPGPLYAGDRYRIRIDPAANKGREPSAFAYGPFFAIKGIPPDAYEPDDARRTAKPIGAGAPAQRRNLALGDTDWASFEGKAGALYVAKAHFGAAATLEITDSAGALEAVSQGEDASIAYAPARDGVYYLRAYGNPPYGDEGGEYGLSLAAFDSLPDGFPLRFTSPDFRVPLTPGSSYEVTWSADSMRFADYVTLDLYRGAAFVCVLRPAILNTGVAMVTLPPDLAVGGDYRLRLAWYWAPEIYAESPAFSIAGAPASPKSASDPAPIGPVGAGKGL